MELKKNSSFHRAVLVPQKTNLRFDLVDVDNFHNDVKAKQGFKKVGDLRIDKAEGKSLSSVEPSEARADGSAYHSDNFFSDSVVDKFIENAALVDPVPLLSGDESRIARLRSIEEMKRIHNRANISADERQRLYQVAVAMDGPRLARRLIAEARDKELEGENGSFLTDDIIAKHEQRKRSRSPNDGQDSDADDELFCKAFDEVERIRSRIIQRASMLNNFVNSPSSGSTSRKPSVSPRSNSPKPSGRTSRRPSLTSEGSQNGSSPKPAKRRPSITQDPSSRQLMSNRSSKNDLSGITAEGKRNGLPVQPNTQPARIANLSQVVPMNGDAVAGPALAVSDISRAIDQLIDSAPTTARDSRASTGAGIVKQDSRSLPKEDSNFAFDDPFFKPKEDKKGLEQANLDEAHRELSFIKKQMSLSSLPPYGGETPDLNGSEDFAFHVSQSAAPDERPGLERMTSNRSADEEGFGFDSEITSHNTTKAAHAQHIRIPSSSGATPLDSAGELVLSDAEGGSSKKFPGRIKNARHGPSSARIQRNAKLLLSSPLSDWLSIGRSLSVEEPGRLVPVDGSRSQQYSSASSKSVDQERSRSALDSSFVYHALPNSSVEAVESSAQPQQLQPVRRRSKFSFEADSFPAESDGAAEASEGVSAKMILSRNNRNLNLRPSSRMGEVASNADLLRSHHDVAFVENVRKALQNLHGHISNLDTCTDISPIQRTSTLPSLGHVDSGRDPSSDAVRRPSKLVSLPDIRSEFQRQGTAAGHVFEEHNPAMKSSHSTHTILSTDQTSPRELRATYKKEKSQSRLAAGVPMLDAKSRSNSTRTNLTVAVNNDDSGSDFSQEPPQGKARPSSGRKRLAAPLVSPHTSSVNGVMTKQISMESSANAQQSSRLQALAAALDAGDAVGKLMAEMLVSSKNNKN